MTIAIARKPSTRLQRFKTEWPTVLLLALQFAGWIAITTWAAMIPVWVAVPALAILTTLHSSLQHEALHGHPTSRPGLNEAFVFLPFGLFIPYRRFRDQHLQHHHDPALTDPYDDPESNYVDPADWAQMSSLCKIHLKANNTLAGRMVFGPAISLWRLYRDDLPQLHSSSAIRDAYFRHIIGLFPVLLWLVYYGSLPLWHYLLSAYLGLSILKIRTFLEHRAHENACARTVIINDRGLLALLFLNNNYHLVHHAYPGLAWHQLPAAFKHKRDIYLTRNKGYYFANYGAVFWRYLFRSKDPVVHPLPDSTNLRRNRVVNSQQNW